MIVPPVTINELVERFTDISGLTLEDIAKRHNIKVPENLKRAKGWVGQLLELELGADAKSKPIPDFTKIGVELKTIPINLKGEPLETTYVCVAPLTNVVGLRWEDSLVYKKLKHVLWVPILSLPELPIKKRQIGTPFLWQASAEQLKFLKQDWEELMEYIALGEHKKLSAKQGEYLQIRPKAADSYKRTNVIGVNGIKETINPKGFYLKKSFTKWLLTDFFG